MKAQELIRQSDLPPDLFTIVEPAFENAWLKLSPQLGKDISPEGARIRLVSIILLLSRIIRDDPERLRTAALKVFNRHNDLDGEAGSGDATNSPGQQRLAEPESTTPAPSV
jgi:hypothetical protein